MTLEEVLANVLDPVRWATPELLMEIIKTPSLRGIVYGYVAEYEFMRYLREVYVFAFLLGARASCSHRRDEGGTPSLPGACVPPRCEQFRALALPERPDQFRKTAAICAMSVARSAMSAGVALGMSARTYPNPSAAARSAIRTSSS